MYSIGYSVLDKLLFFVKKNIFKYSSHSILHSLSEKDEKLEKTQSYNGLNAENTYIDVLWVPRKTQVLRRRSIRSSIHNCDLVY